MFLIVVQPETFIRWHRKGFKLLWAYKSRKKGSGQPSIDFETRALIKKMAKANPLWGAPRIHGELLKLGYNVHERTVSNIIKRFRARKPPSQTWRTFLKNHMFNTFAADLFTVKTAPQSPWQNPYVERLIGSIRRDCINAMIILNEVHLKRILTEYFAYYHQDGTHLGLAKETPASRSVQEKPDNVKVVALPRLCGLHHRKECILMPKILLAQQFSDNPPGQGGLVVFYAGSSVVISSRVFLKSEMSLFRKVVLRIMHLHITV